ncbi:hypothetical protein [Corallococcus sp. EGB]|uniref:hypothetical protein n=1 Tax=Corallococcus sp. EGB TaxID=1521117 RepID=UPI001CC1261B|nr:hypothetical protein [Corallococcus sp. EGB]
MTSLDDAKLVPSGHYTNDVGESSAPYRSSVTSLLNTVSGALNSEKFSCGIDVTCHLARAGANWHLGNLLEASQTYDHYAPVSSFAATSLTVNHFIPFVDAGESVNKVKPGCTSGGFGQCASGIAKAGGHTLLAGAAIYGMASTVGGVVSKGTSLLSKGAVKDVAKGVTEFTAHVQGGGGVMAQLGEDGFVDLWIKKAPGTPSGGQMFREALAAFGERVKGVRGTWINSADMGDKFRAFKLAERGLLSPEDAAQSGTFTGKMSLKAGFNKVRVLLNDVDKVVVEFTQ